MFGEIDIPDGKVLIPGVLDSTNNYIEHPELVAQRIERLANLVGRENVMAGSDCGFGTFVRACRPSTRTSRGPSSRRWRRAPPRVKETLELAGVKSLGPLPSHPASLTLIFLASGLKASTSKRSYTTRRCAASF